MEVAPGIHRIEADLGERYVCQYLLVGDERTLLVDTGLRDMPEEVIAPYAAELASVVIWIGYIQWLRDNGYSMTEEPILRGMDMVVQQDAILAFNADGSLDLFIQRVPPAQARNRTGSQHQNPAAPRSALALQRPPIASCTTEKFCAFFLAAGQFSPTEPNRMLPAGRSFCTCMQLPY
jgi:hypothetical protein